MWDPGFRLQERIADPALLVGAGVCPQTVVGLGAEERANHYEIWLHRTGSRGVDVGGERVVGNVATVVFVNPGDVVRPEYPREELQRSTVMLLHEDLLRELLAEVDERHTDRRDLRFPAPAALLPSSAALLHRRLLHGGADGGSLDEGEISLMLLRELLRIDGTTRTSRPRSAPARRSAAGLVEAVQHILSCRYAEKLTLSQLGRIVGVSPFHLTRTFADQVGIPLYRYLRRVRLRIALEMMSQRPRDLSWVALEAGFASHSHFTSTFGAEYGVPPSEVARGL